jgi:hypothetical protein
VLALLGVVVEEEPCSHRQHHRVPDRPVCTRIDRSEERVGLRQHHDEEDRAQRSPVRGVTEQSRGDDECESGVNECGDHY